MDIDAPLPLLGGLSPAQFMRRHWEKKPLLVRQAWPGIRPPVTRAQAFALASSDDVESRLVVRSGGGWQVKHGPLPRRALPPVAQPEWTLLVQGQLGEATRSLSTVVDLAIETVQPSLASTALHQLAATARILGEYDQSQALNERSVALNREVMGTASTLASLWPRIASALLSLNSGKVDEAEGRLQRVLTSLGDGSNFSNYRNSANIGMGLVALARGDLDRGEALIVDALDDPANLYPYMRVQAWLGLARIARLRKDDARADKLLRTALHFAGYRSLLEEYIETVLEIARQQPSGAPVNRLIDDLIDYIRPIHFTAAIARLEAARLLSSPPQPQPTAA